MNSFQIGILFFLLLTLMLLLAMYLPNKFYKFLSLILSLIYNSLLVILSLIYNFLLVILSLIYNFLLVTLSLPHRREIFNQYANKLAEKTVIENINQNIDWLSLQKWYQRQARKQARRQAWVLRIMIFLFALINLISVVFLIDYVNGQKEKRIRLTQQEAVSDLRDYNDLLEIEKEVREIGPIIRENDYKRIKREENGITNFLIIVALSLMQLIPFLFSNISNRLKTTNHKKINRDIFKDIWVLIDNLTKTMGITYEIEFYLLQVDSFEAHVLKKDSKVILYLSRNMISFYSQDKEKFRAIIAHEFGHVLQNDTRFLLVGVKYLKVALNISILGLLISYLSGSNYDAITIFMFLSLVNYELFKSTRHKAEYLADMASVCYLENTKIVEVLNLSTTQYNNYYPEKLQRIEYISDNLSKFTYC